MLCHFFLNKLPYSIQEEKRDLNKGDGKDKDKRKDKLQSTKLSKIHNSSLTCHFYSFTCCFVQLFIVNTGWTYLRRLQSCELILQKAYLNNDYLNVI